MKKASMRPDLLLVTTQGVKGGTPHTNMQGSCRIKVQKGFNEPENSIWVDVYEGLGHTYKAAETAKINISFANGTEWNGTFDQLHSIIADAQTKDINEDTARSVAPIY